MLNNLKNIWGWKTPRKIVVISVDDYGNVRLDSKQAREKMDQAGLKVQSRFDAFDALETREDLEHLFDVLRSVKDKNGHHAVFTPFALPCNINFEKVVESDFSGYWYETLPETYGKLATGQPGAYEDAWKMWESGISDGLMKPQFHGREHLNLKVLLEKLAAKDHEVLTALRNRSYTSLSNSGYTTISYTAAFDFWEKSENASFAEIIKEGVGAFEKVFRYKTVHFNSPGGREHPIIHELLKREGIKYIDTPLVKYEHQGLGKYKRVINYTGKKNHLNMFYQVRNVVFEPTHDRGINWVNYTLDQIEAAFRWHKPAIISSHRVNFCGHIDEDNRKKGLGNLKLLLQQMVKKWPDVEFMSANELGELMEENK
jgi:hypothetical protein